MKEENLYYEFLKQKDVVEDSVGKKLEVAIISNGVVGYQIDPSVLNTVIDVLALNGDIQNDEKIKNVYKNSYLFARKVAYYDFYMGSRGLLHDTIMSEIFSNAVKAIKGLRPMISYDKNGDVVPFEYSECLNMSNQDKLIDCYGLEDGICKNPKEITGKDGTFVSFCSRFIDRLYKKNRNKCK